MNSGRATNRQFACCLMLSAVLILGIVQWSFLPVLLQNPSQSSRAFVEVSSGHTSKFAAPFKCLLGDFQQPCLKQSSFAVSPTPVRYFLHPKESDSRRDDQFFSFRQLRSPPSA
jgi:hypothetical protein